ncbi:hypothetical protein R1flu_002708 [Riccia fluitans]|uniref:Secreted protein n=1 Tax=Riccia fluitans TaxID=41844 RepID=A0ABD1Y752_9MARC
MGLAVLVAVICRGKTCVTLSLAGGGVYVLEWWRQAPGVGTGCSQSPTKIFIYGSVGDGEEAVDADGLKAGGNGRGIDG